MVLSASLSVEWPLVVGGGGPEASGRSCWLGTHPRVRVGSSASLYLHSLRSCQESSSCGVSAVVKITQRRCSKAVHQVRGMRKRSACSSGNTKRVRSILVQGFQQPPRYSSPTLLGFLAFLASPSDSLSSVFGFSSVQVPNTVAGCD